MKSLLLLVAGGLVLFPAGASASRCSRALRVALSQTIRPLQQESSEKREAAFNRQTDALREAFSDLETVQEVARAAPFFRSFYPVQLENLYVTRDLIVGLRDYFDQHGELLSLWASDMARGILGLDPCTEENLSKWGGMLFPPKPRRMQAPDLMGFRQHVIETSTADNIDLVEYLEHADERTSGLPNLVEQTYHGTIHYHLDSILHRRHSAHQRWRASLLRQRRRTLPHAIVFFSPTLDQQHWWARELTKDRWRDVPRVYIGNTMEWEGWIQEPEFLNQLDRARIDVLLPKEEGLRTRVETITTVGTGLNIESLATDIHLTRPLLALPGDPMTVKVADFRISNDDTDEGQKTQPYYPRLKAMDDADLSDEIRRFASKFPFLSEENDRMTYTARRGIPIQLELSGLDEGELRILFYP